MKNKNERLTKEQFELKYGKGRLTKINGNLYVHDLPFLVSVLIVVLICTIGLLLDFYFK